MAAESFIEMLRRSPAEAHALVSADGSSLTYGKLAQIVEGAASDLADRGASGRVATITDDARTAAVLFLAVSTLGTAAPLSSRLRPAETVAALDHLGVTTVVADTAAAWSLAPHLPATVDLVTADVGDGRLGLSGTAESATRDTDYALVLRTSGTTGRAKTVGLTHRQLLRSAERIAAWLGLDPRDRSLVVMPLFHIHGLVAGLLATLSSGGTAIVPPRFDAIRFGRWLTDLTPTWYTAVPTMHRMILERVGPDRVESTLSFIRSSSSRLAPSLMESLEHTFGVPVVEAYGMTEAAHQIASNPLPPGRRILGTVGVPTGTEVSILDANWREVPGGSEGEITIRGDTVIDAYADGAGADSFRNGWFRTGDLGRITEAGHLIISGRVKESINRGGETINPGDIEAVLLEISGVVDAGVFAVPHESLGETIGCCLVLESGAEATEMRSLARERLSGSRRPTRYWVVDEIPTGPTGKVQRSLLWERLRTTPPTLRQG